MDHISQLILPATMDNLTVLIESVAGSARSRGFDQDKISQIELALEEALVNIIHYAYPSEKGDIQVSCKLDGEDRFVIEIVDWGVAFDVLSAEEPDVEAGVAQREVGGLGIFLIKKLMHAVDYKRDRNQNILTLTV